MFWEVEAAIECWVIYTNMTQQRCFVKSRQSYFKWFFSAWESRLECWWSNTCSKKVISPSALKAAIECWVIHTNGVVTINSGCPKMWESAIYFKFSKIHPGAISTMKIDFSGSSALSVSCLGCSFWCYFHSEDWLQWISCTSYLLPWLYTLADCCWSIFFFFFLLALLSTTSLLVFNFSFQYVFRGLHHYLIGDARLINRVRQINMIKTVIDLQIEKKIL